MLGSKPAEGKRMNNPVTSSKKPRFSKGGLLASLIAAFFVLLTLALLFTPVAGPLRYGFPALTFVVSVVIYYQSRPFFAGFVVWLWMIAPLVRASRGVSRRRHRTPCHCLAIPRMCCTVGC